MLIVSKDCFPTNSDCTVKPGAAGCEPGTVNVGAPLAGVICQEAPARGWVDGPWYVHVIVKLPFRRA